MGAEDRDDVALTILHTADWHLGMRFKAFEREDEVKLTRARLEVIDHIFRAAASFRVDAVVAAGDQFDGPSPDEHWWRGLLDRINAFDWTSRPLVLLPGNHDPLTPSSVYDPRHSFRAGLPPGVHVVDSEGWELEIGARGGRGVIVGTPCRSRAGETNVVRSLPPRQAGDERIRIGLVHGQTVDITGFETNFPIDVEAAGELGLDYLALGDTHRHKIVAKRPVMAVYPGAPEPTSFKTAGGKPSERGSAAVVMFPGHGRPPILKREHLGRWQWSQEICRDLAALRSLRDQPNGRQKVMRLVLDMTVGLSELDEVERLLTELRGTEANYGRVGALQVDRAGLRMAEDIDPGEFPDDMPHVLQVTVERLRQRVDEGFDADRAKRALFHLWRLVHTRGEAP